MNIDEKIEGNINEFINNINKNRPRDKKFTEKEKNIIVKNLHPFKINVSSTIIYVFGFILFICLWFFIKADNYITKKTIWAKYFVFIFLIFVTLINIWLSTEEAGNYETELEIQRSVEQNSFYVSAGSLALALFAGYIVTYFKPDKNSIKLPFLLLSLAFIFSYFILLFINLPKIGVFRHYYRNIITQFLNLSIMYVIAAIVFVIAIMRN